MSSIVKKSSHFTPKLKKRVVRKESPATPPASQVPDNAKAETTTNNEGEAQISPPATQVSAEEQKTAPKNAQNNAQPAQNTQPMPTPQSSQNPLLSYSISTKLSPGPSRKDETEPIVDPKSKVSESAVRESSSEADSENEEDYGNNDIFKQPLIKEQYARRRSSIVSHRRLSGINANRRNSSISIPGTPGAGPSDADHVREAPVTIGVPSGKTVKKRRASSVSRQGRKVTRASVISIPPVTDTLKEEQDEADTETDAASVSTTTKLTAKDAPASSTHKSPVKSTGGEDYIVGLDPKTRKFRKFKTSDEVFSDLPVAPPNLITSISSVRELPRRVKKEDEDLFSRVSVSTESISMADLCKPMIQIGSKSEMFELAETAKEKLLKKKDERRTARETARRLRIPYKRALRELQSDQIDPDDDRPKNLDFKQMEREQAQSTSTLKLAVVEGQIQVDQESVIRGRGLAPNSENRKVELENPFENPITANTYSRSVHTDPWTKEEVIELYKALSTWGTDFTFIAQLFPYRTRRQIKNKFTLEEKHNPQLVELALRRKLPADLEDFCASAFSVKSLKSVDEFNREMADLKKDHESHMREINAEREKAIKEDLEFNRKREIEIRTGSKPMTKAERSRMIRQNEVVVGEIEDVKRTRESFDAGNV
ncbi:hypothetical protein JCM33374_g6199 [Metschnikowia sp. JCM 33374]|nr:hypothetical protein JCM33374_g6199 [Metschnikowia sp. JCM 33374]